MGDGRDSCTVSWPCCVGQWMVRVCGRIISTLRKRQKERQKERETNGLRGFRYVNAEERGGKEALIVAGAAAVGTPLILSGFLIQLRSVTGCFLATALCTSVISLRTLTLTLTRSCLSSFVHETRTLSLSLSISHSVCVLTWPRSVKLLQFHPLCDDEEADAAVCDGALWCSGSIQWGFVVPTWPSELKQLKRMKRKSLRREERRREE